MDLQLLISVATALVVALFLGVRARRRADQGALLADAEQRSDALERELGSLRRSHIQLSQDHQLLVGFLRSFPSLTRSLLTGASEREIPGFVVNALRHSLASSRVMVLLRRRAPPEAGEHRLVIAACAPPDASAERTVDNERRGIHSRGAPNASAERTVDNERRGIHSRGADDALPAVGAEVPMGKGELGFAATAQRVMSRRDFELESLATRARLRDETPKGFEFDLLAPIVDDEETLGLIALSGLGGSTESMKAAVWLVAQTAGQALRNAQTMSHIKNTADLDGLTGVYNKRYLTEALAERVFEAQRMLQPASLFLFDVDNFKHYNDTNGHVAGDHLLRKLARLVAESVRKDDIFGRFGGEEFLLVLPGTPLAHALAVAEKIRATIAGHPFDFAAKQPLGCLSISGGVAECPRDGLDSTRLLAAADEALYKAKDQGRNRVLPARRFDLSLGEVAVPGDRR